MKRRIWLIVLLAAGGAACNKNSDSGSGGGSNAPVTVPGPTPTAAPGATPTPAPAPNGTIALYNDQGGVLGQPNVLLFTGGGLQLAEKTGDAPEGTKYLQATQVAQGAFVGITFDKNNSGQTRDFSPYTAGSIRFWIRLDHALTSGTRFKINLTDGKNATVGADLATQPGFDPSKATQWQEVTVPLSQFAGLDFAHLKVPFALALDASGGAVYRVDLDDIRVLETGGGAPPATPAATTSPTSAPASAPGATGGALYNDQGGVLGQANVLLFTGGGLQLAEKTGDAPEGTKFLRATQVAQGGFLGITFDKSNTGQSVDETTFADGSLRFWIRLDRPLASGARFNINLTDANNKTVSADLARQPGFDGGKANTWQDVTVPLSQFAGLDFAHLKVPFALAVDASGGVTYQIDLDNIRLLTTGGNAPIGPAPTTTPTPTPAPTPTPTPTPAPSGVLYNDQGGVLGQANVLLFTGGGVMLAEKTGDAPEGTKFLRLSQAAQGAFAGITFDKNNTGQSVDESRYSAGSLRFWIRLDRPLAAGARFNVNLTDAKNKTVSADLSRQPGFDGGKANTWQDVTVPLSQFAGLDFAHLKVPFALAVDANGGVTYQIDLDNIRLLTTGGNAPIGPAPTTTPTPTPAPTPTPTPAPSNQLGLYNDQGGILGQSGVLLFLGGSLTLQEETGTPPEGTKFLAFSGADNGSFWGITYAKTDPTAIRDLSDFANGTLNFSLRLRRPLAVGEKILVDVKDPQTGSPTVLTAAAGFSGAATDWQNISLPLSMFSSNKARTQVPIAMSFQGLSSPLSFDIDNVRWQR